MTYMAGVSSSMELVVDVTSQTRTIDDLVLRCVSFLESHSIDAENVQTFRLLLSEALANALEHGIFRLPHSVKEDPFNASLITCLDETISGQIRLKVSLLNEDSVCNSKNAVSIELSDSGQGFDWRNVMQSLAMPSPDKFYGRGLALIKACSTQLSFNEAGNTISFVIPID
jgi:anti-sigma regulatory factor (Ser/Thr protein kinase)